MNELDALANINFNTRYEKDHLRQLELVRIGTCGGLQPYTCLLYTSCGAIVLSTPKAMREASQ